MRQLAQYQDGRLELQDVPAPVPPPGGILVRTTCSVISPGTERMKVEQARMSLLQKAKARPDQVKKVLDTAKTLGWKAAMEKVRNRLESPTPLGYSAAGVVAAVDELNTRFRVGDRVACGGAECAHHAEMIAVPDLLAAPIPEGVEDWQAAYTTLASISMEAVRQSGARLGERVLVMGQGLVGLLATSLLKASGARVMAADFVASRLDVSRQMGAERVVNPGQSKLEDEVRDWTGGHGVDAVLLCVGGKGREAADSAIDCLRDRGVMVIVGIYDAELSWKTAYMKDIQVRYSRSYGPGRYDPQYEWGGQDYPIGHVRWTENRNFEACLELMRTGQLDLKPVTTRRVRFDEVTAVYDSLESEVGIVVQYDLAARRSVLECAGPPALSDVSQPAGSSRGLEHSKTLSRMPCTSLDVIGAGNFARTMLLPHLKGKIAFGTIVNATGLSARHVKEKFSFADAGTDAAKVLGASGGAVSISTRHHLHAAQVLLALQSGKQVFVEKPLCLTREELAEIDEAMTKTSGSVMVGFNRRFAPATAAMMEVLKSVSGPKTLAFHVNAGVLAPDHWYANVAESGGRVLGEACHFFDFACHVLGRPVQVTAQTIGRPKVPDSVTAQLEFADGSSAQLIYSAEGDSAFAKESFRVFANGLVVECENFMTLSIFQKRKKSVMKFSSKGHAEEMAAWLAYLKAGAEHPLPYEQSRQSMRLTFAALDSIREARSISL
ncbi:MAG: bi-domain-containing oxidoreductase [Prosthecobacter sp.]|uniref:bi-domain-containing oxidoreductase n=1 Tax=Prosthecobacter sp. TaxID=1965333 RepID=UPI001A002CA0|nr:bi-domain-containing oxidoreductase [Prosthecobacter sp.]MBE2283729.1 bi-domain-containing oxidoreductase [Prosthecobacter sp.]